jgi:hypothetical protein
MKPVIPDYEWITYGVRVSQTLVNPVLQINSAQLTNQAFIVYIERGVPEPQGFIGLTELFFNPC